MTISSTARKAGPFNGNDSTTTFPFAFKVFSTSDVVVVHTDADGAESTLVLGTDYTVSLNADQDVSPGGNVVKTTALATGIKLTITSDVQNLQPVDLTNQGGFYPKVLSSALDRLTILVQQVAEQVSRAVKTGISSSQTPDEMLASISAAAVNSQAAAISASASATLASGFSSAASASADEAGESAAAAAGYVVPSQSGNAGKYLRTNGSSVSWDGLDGQELDAKSVDTAQLADNCIQFEQLDPNVWSLGRGGIANVTASRAFGTTYYNMTGKPLFVSVLSNSTSNSACSTTLSIGGITTAAQSINVAYYVLSVYGIVPPGEPYSVDATNCTLQTWSEVS